MILAIILVLDKVNFSSAAKGGHMLVVTADETFNPTAKTLWEPIGIVHHILHIKVLADNVREYTIGIQAKNDTALIELSHTLKKQSAVHSVEIISGKDAVEY